MNKRQAISEARASADTIIEQVTRWSNGWDKGAYRDDDTVKMFTASATVTMESHYAFALSKAFT